MGTGPMMSGSLDIDDSVNDNASNNDVTLSAVQTYSGATYVEAGTLTLGVANALEDSSGVTLGRVGGAVDSQTATLVLDASNQLSSLSSDADNTTLVVLNGETLTLTPASGTEPRLRRRGQRRHAHGRQRCGRWGRHGHIHRR